MVRFSAFYLVQQIIVIISHFLLLDLLSYSKGKYIGAGSCETGDLFVWKTADGSLVNQLKGHGAGVVAVAWERGGTNGQQVSSVDKDGNLLLWA